MITAVASQNVFMNRYSLSSVALTTLSSPGSPVGPLINDARRDANGMPERTKSVSCSNRRPPVRLFAGMDSSFHNRVERATMPPEQSVVEPDVGLCDLNLRFRCRETASTGPLPGTGGPGLASEVRQKGRSDRGGQRVRLVSASPAEPARIPADR